MNEDEPTPVMMVVTCRTPECAVEDVSYTLPMYANATEPIYLAMCQQCSQIVTDIVPVP